MEQAVAHKKRRHIFLRLLIYENILGGAGRLICYGAITLRYALFAISLLYFVFNIKKFRANKSLFYSFAVLCGVILMGVVVGVLRSNEFADIFTQGKSYLFILMIFPYCLLIDSKQAARQAVKSFVNASVITAFITLVIFVAVLGGMADFDTVNLFLEGKELGHIAHVGDFIRVFFKVCPAFGIAFIVEVIDILSKRLSVKSIPRLVKAAVLGAGVIVSMTMGLWLAAAIAVVVMIFVLDKQQRSRFAFYAVPIVAAALFVAGEFIVWTLTQRISTSDASVIIKVNQLNVMLEQWQESMFFGKGFGHWVTFYTQLGTRKMLTIENSWLEILVTFGTFGFLYFVGFFAFMVYKCFYLAKWQQTLQEKNTLRAMGLGVVLLCIVTTFNPFIINPIGLGFIAMMFALINRYSIEKLYSEIGEGNG